MGSRASSIALASLLGVFLLAAGCGGGGSTEGSGKLETIASVAQFQRAFDAEDGHARLVILLSPT